MTSTPAHRVAAARRVAQRLQAAASIAVATHVNGDGDGWGTACAVAHHFLPLGKDIRLLAATPLPRRFRFLLPDAITPLGPGAAGRAALSGAEVQLVVDATEPARLGEFAPLFEPQRTIVVDHHAVASKHIEASLTFVDPAAAASAELLYDVLAQTQEPLRPGTATALYVALVTDTGSFRYSNTTPHAHRLAAALIEAGADPGALYGSLFANLTPAELATLQATLAGLRHEDEIGLVWSTLTAEAVRRTGALDEYEGVIDHLRNVAGTQIAVLFRELEGGVVKVSLRSSGPANVAAVARGFGGGGHEKAAGANVVGTLDEVARQVLEACRAALRRG